MFLHREIFCLGAILEERNSGLLRCKSTWKWHYRILCFVLCCGGSVSCHVLFCFAEGVFRAMFCFVLRRECFTSCFVLRRGCFVSCFVLFCGGSVSCDVLFCGGSVSRHVLFCGEGVSCHGFWSLTLITSIELSQCTHFYDTKLDQTSYCDDWEFLRS